MRAEKKRNEKRINRTDLPGAEELARKTSGLISAVDRMVVGRRYSPTTTREYSSNYFWEGTAYSSGRSPL